MQKEKNKKDFSTIIKSLINKVIRINDLKIHINKKYFWDLVILVFVPIYMSVVAYWMLYN